MSMADPSSDPAVIRLIDEIVEYFFTNGSGQKADRLVLTVDSVPKRDLGGWCRAAIRDHLRAHLGVRLSARSPEEPIKPSPDVVCEHGTAMDVHCCDCHSGFLFDAESCVCRFDTDIPAMREIARVSMTACSDPHAEPLRYRQALIDVCNLALKSIDLASCSSVTEVRERE